MTDAHRIDPTARPYDPEAVPRKPDVEFGDLAAIDLRVGTVLDAEEFPEARDPALKLTVDFGPHVGVLRTSAKIANYRPDELVGRQVIGAVNLGDKRIAGFVSQFLVLGGLEGDGTVHLLGIDHPLPPGSVVG